MTSKEIIELLEIKKANAEADFELQKDPLEKLYILGKIDAYQALITNFRARNLKEKWERKEEQAL